ncbi:hypothetical protein JY651_09490 [Pyxidicoccus parkwayensis]|uniref:Uncharacterized protein n=1 Tax=Pyxidicoccus parkwayensis TaxID=2813578 RepID=A0ABX7P3U2_9BACT|nr:hypothetical protein [Pyxidicoccus parkwaysis]QSQ25139.1 hypothetical protein JY651_09490 [Pyxidicoccus parkwaysis]
MKLLVLPPHRDVTLVPDAPQGWHVVDVARDFCRRVLSDAALTESIDDRVTGTATPQSMRELLLLRSARTLLGRESRRGHAFDVGGTATSLLTANPSQSLAGQPPSGRDGVDDHTRLRAIGAVLTAISGPPNGIRLRLDDLELEDGTTERSADVLRALGQPAPFTEDLARAAERFTQAERVRLWLERDQQLPAAAWLARACPQDVPLEVAGPFAAAHRKVLARMPMFQRAEFIDDAAPLHWRVAPLLGEPRADSLLWIPESLDLLVYAPPLPLDEHDALLFEETEPRDLRTLTTKQVLGACTPDELKVFTRGGPWGGHVMLGSLGHAEALIEGGCRVAVVGFCAVSGGRVMDPYGYWHNTHVLVQGAQRLRAAGVRLVAEWWVGAPGVDEAVLEETLSALASEPLFDHVAGVRPFHWSLEHRGIERASMEPLPSPPDRDLARSQPFEAPNTIPTSRLPEVLANLSTRLMQRAPLNPGRVAGANLRGPTAFPHMMILTVDYSEHSPIRLDDDCALVQLPASLDGAPKPTWYAANLRTGTVLAMDARLAPKLSTLDRPTQVSEVLGAVPEAQRQKLVNTLVAKTVLTRVHE